MTIFPQEIELWYVLPALRREFSRELTQKHNLSQRKAAEILGVTEAAVSQYKSNKRAKNVILDKKILSEVEKSAENIVAKGSTFIGETQKIFKLLKDDQTLCKIHMHYDKSLPENCRLCFEEATK